MGKKGLLGLQQIVDFHGRLLFQWKRSDIVVLVIIVGSSSALSALFRQTKPSGRRKDIPFFLEELLALSLPRGYLCAQSMRNLVAGSDRRDFFPHAVLELEKASSRFMNDADHGLCHLHLFLLAGGNVIAVCKVFQDLLEVSVSGVRRADPGLATENILRCGSLNAGRFLVDGILGSGRGRFALLLRLGSRKLC